MRLRQALPDATVYSIVFVVRMRSFPPFCASSRASVRLIVEDRAPAAAGFEADDATERVLGPLLRQKLREAKGYAPVPS